MPLAPARRSDPKPTADAAGGRAHSYATLDGLRGVAALVVLLYHVHEDIFAPHGYLAVDLFFAMSGFVVASAYEGRLAEGLGVGAFFGIRVRRLAPLWIAGVFVGLAMVLAVPTGVPTRTLLLLTLPALLLVPHGMAFERAFPMNGCLWSLHVELVVNIVFAWAHRFLTTRVLLAVSAFSFLALAVIGYGQGAVSNGATSADMLCGYLRALIAFPLGVVLFRCRVRLAWLKLPAPAVLLIAAVLIAGLGVSATGAVGVTYDLAFIGLAIPALVCLAVGQEPATWLRPLFSRMGTGSYALYALHEPIIQAARRLTLGHGDGAAYMVLGVALIPAMLLLAWLADRLFDAPVQRWLKTWRGSPKSVARLEPATP